MKSTWDLIHFRLQITNLVVQSVLVVEGHMQIAAGPRSIPQWAADAPEAAW